MGVVYDKLLEYRRRHPGGIAFRTKKHSDEVEKFINFDEEVLYAFCAQRNDSFLEIFNTYVVVLTNKRVLMAHKRLLWGSFYHTITPDLYNDMQIYSGLIWGKLTIDTVKELVTLTNIPKDALPEIETEISRFMIEAKKEYKKKDEKK